MDFSFSMELLREDAGRESKIVAYVFPSFLVWSQEDVVEKVYA